MADVVDKATRSRMMSKIRGRDTKPELLVRRFLHGKGLRYRLSPRDVVGKPDLVFPKHRVVVFVHGCFWHRHPGCKYTTTPSSNTKFWQSKFEANAARDELVKKSLRKIGWKVIVVWGCQLSEKNLSDLEHMIRDR